MSLSHPSVPPPPNEREMSEIKKRHNIISLFWTPVYRFIALDGRKNVSSWIQEFEYWCKSEKQKEKKPAYAPGWQDCHSSEKCHWDFCSTGTSSPPELSWISVHNILLPSPPQADRQDLLGWPALKQLQWHLASRTCRCLILECSMQERWMPKPRVVCQREQWGGESLISNSADAEGWSPCQKEEIPSSASHNRYLAPRWKPECEQEEKETRKAVKAALSSTSLAPSKGSASNWFFLVE